MPDLFLPLPSPMSKDYSRGFSDFNQFCCEQTHNMNPVGRCHLNTHHFTRVCSEVNSANHVTMKLQLSDCCSQITLRPCCSSLFFFFFFFFLPGNKEHFGWCRHSLKLVFGMINDTCNLWRKVQAVLRLGEENWSTLDKGVGGPRSSRWKPTCTVMLRCAAMPLRDQLSGTQWLDFLQLLVS